MIFMFRARKIDGYTGTPIWGLTHLDFVELCLSVPELYAVFFS